MKKIKTLIALSDRQIELFEELIDGNLFANKDLIHFAKKFPSLANLIGLKILEHNPTKLELAYIIKHIPVHANTAAANYLTMTDSSVDYELALAFIVRHASALAGTLLTKSPVDYIAPVIRAVLHSENDKTAEFVDYVLNGACSPVYLRLIIKHLPNYRDRAFDAYVRFKLTDKDRAIINKYGRGDQLELLKHH